MRAPLPETFEAPGGRAAPTRQHRTTVILLLNTGVGAVAGLAFWFVAARWAGLGPADVGAGYTAIAIATTVALLAKGGLDIAVVRLAPAASSRRAAGLTALAALLAASLAAVLTGMLALTAALGPAGTVRPATWMLMGAIATLLAVTWIQDAQFLAGRAPHLSLARSCVLAVARVALIVPFAMFAVGHSIALAWAAALAASAAFGLLLSRRLPDRTGRHVRQREFLRTATANVSGSAAEFLPGLLLAPIVYASAGASAAGYFAIAWAAASLLILGAAAIGRSALVELSRHGHEAAAVRRAALEIAVLVLPAALVGALAPSWFLGLVGPQYAQNAAGTMSILCLSAFVTAPIFLWVAVLRHRGRPLELVVLPVALIATLLALQSTFAAMLAPDGVAWSWLIANAPFAAYCIWRLGGVLLEGRDASSEVMPRDAAPVGRRAHLE